MTFALRGERLQSDDHKSLINTDLKSYTETIHLPVQAASLPLILVDAGLYTVGSALIIFSASAIFGYYALGAQLGLLCGLAVGMSRYTLFVIKQGTQSHQIVIERHTTTEQKREHDYERVVVEMTQQFLDPETGRPGVDKTWSADWMPVSRPVMEQIAKHVLTGSAFSRDVLTKSVDGLSQQDYPTLQQRFLELGYVKQKGKSLRQGVLVTEKGKAVFRAFLPQPVNQKSSQMVIPN